MPFAAQLVALLKKQQKEETAEYASALDAWGDALDGNNQSAEAEPLLLQGMALRQKILGKEDQDVATSMHHLGVLYLHLGNYTPDSHKRRHGCSGPVSEMGSKPQPVEPVPAIHRFDRTGCRGFPDGCHRKNGEGPLPPLRGLWQPGRKETGQLETSSEEIEAGRSSSRNGAGYKIRNSKNGN